MMSKIQQRKRKNASLRSKYIKVVYDNLKNSKEPNAHRNYLKYGDKLKDLMDNGNYKTVQMIQLFDEYNIKMIHIIHFFNSLERMYNKDSKIIYTVRNRPNKNIQSLFLNYYSLHYPDQMKNLLFIYIKSFCKNINDDELMLHINGIINEVLEQKSNKPNELSINDNRIVISSPIDDIISSDYNCLCNLDELKFNDDSNFDENTDDIFNSNTEIGTVDFDDFNFYLF